MSKSQRTKGAGGERELCALLSDAFGVKVTRKLGQARDSGNDIDLQPFRIEVKRRKRIANLYDWLAQAAKYVGTVKYPDTLDGMKVKPGKLYDTRNCVLAIRADGKDWLVVMRLQDWIELAREEIAK